jgi:RimJ/RimL family protein N-acetyltransferase
VITVEGGVLYGADQIVARLVNEKCGGEFEPGVIQAALGILSSDGLVGGVIFSNYMPGRDITISVAVEGKRLWRPHLLARCLAYPFWQLELPRVTAEIDAANERSLRNALKLGFIPEGRKRGIDVCVMGLLRSEFPFQRYLPETPREGIITAACA